MFLAGCRTPSLPRPAPRLEARQGDEIIAAGELFHTGTRVVTWMDPGGYDAHPGAQPRNPRRVSSKPAKGAPSQNGELAALQGTVDQFVLHYDGCGLSKLCFKVLRERGLSVHFLLDLDGTVYQTLDLRARALHATTSNDRSIGVEIANLGAYPPGEAKVLAGWYKYDARGEPSIKVPAAAGDPMIRTKNFVGRPARFSPLRGAVQRKTLVQYDFTPEQYTALAKLTAALCRVFPGLKCDYPRDAAGRLVAEKLSEKELARYQGVLGHFHIQTNKIDPGPALQWDTLINEARQLAK